MVLMRVTIFKVIKKKHEKDIYTLVRSLGKVKRKSVKLF